MKWFKHYSDSLDDPFVQALLDKFSHFGYVAYFGLIEIISKENGTNITGNLSISPTYLRRKLRSSQGKLRQVFDFCQTFGKLSVTFSEEKWEFQFDKMLEIKDNYTKDLQAAGKKPSNHKEVRVKNKNKEKDKETTFAQNDKIVFDWSSFKFENLNGKVELFKEKYPAVNVGQEMLSMEAWLMANPKNRKSNYERFITNWLQKTQDRTRGQPKEETEDQLISRKAEEMRRRMKLDENNRRSICEANENG